VAEHWEQAAQRVCGRLLLWRYSKPSWTWSCAACSRRPCFVRGLD